MVLFFVSYNKKCWIFGIRPLHLLLLQETYACQRQSYQENLLLKSVDFILRYSLLNLADAFQLISWNGLF